MKRRTANRENRCVSEPLEHFSLEPLRPKLLDISALDHNNRRNCIYYEGKQCSRQRYLLPQKSIHRNRSLYELYKLEQHQQREELLKRANVRRDLLDTLIGRYKIQKVPSTQHTEQVVTGSESRDEGVKELIRIEQDKYRLLSQKVELLDVNQQPDGRVRVCSKKTMCQRTYPQEHRLNRKYVARTRRIDQAIRTNLKSQPPNLQSGSPWGQMSVVREEPFVETAGC